MKQKIVFEDNEKRTLVYRYQRSGDEQPLLMRWNQEFEKMERSPAQQWHRAN